MPELVEIADEIGPAVILHVYDPDVGMKGVVVIDTTVHGRASGGTRMLPDITTEEMAGLARAMTHKYATLDIPADGTKAGIWANPTISGRQREDILRAFGKAVRPLLTSGLFLGTDMGTATDYGSVSRQYSRGAGHINDVYRKRSLVPMTRELSKTHLIVKVLLIVQNRSLFTDIDKLPLED